MWKELGTKKVSPFDKSKDQQSPAKLTPEEAEAESKKRKSYLKYNRSRNGVFGDKSEPELIEKDL